MRCKLNNARWAQALFLSANPNSYPAGRKNPNLNIEHARVKRALPPHVVPDVAMFVTTYVEAHGIPA